MGTNGRVNPLVSRLLVLDSFEQLLQTEAGYGGVVYT